MSDPMLAFTSAWELARLVRSRKLSPVELIEMLLARIEALNPQLNAYLSVGADAALAAARDAERQAARGGELPTLLGVPVSIKDTIRAEGLPCTGGSLVYRGSVADSDAVVVERLRAAGAIILGKTNTPEFALSATTENRLGDDCRNPWDPTRTSGGSSGGAAASVAAGMGPLAIGSDGGGSVRIPAALCGVFGFKPTYGTIPAAGGFGGMPYFSHIGPLTRSTLDAAMVLDVVAGYDPRDPNSRRSAATRFSRNLGRLQKDLRVAWTPDLGYAVADPEVMEAVVKAAGVFEALGCPVETASPDIQEPFEAFGPIVSADAYAAFGTLLESKSAELSEMPRRTIERGREVTGETYSRCLRRAEAIRAAAEDFFDNYDLLLTPATAVPAFPCGLRPREVAGVRVSGLWGAFPFSVPFNISRQPAASVPIGESASGLPIGVQIVGRYGADRLVLQAAAALEEALPWAQRLPPTAQ